MDQSNTIKRARQTLNIRVRYFVKISEKHDLSSRRVSIYNLRVYLGLRTGSPLFNRFVSMSCLTDTRYLIIFTAK